VEEASAGAGAREDEVLVLMPGGHLGEWMCRLLQVLARLGLGVLETKPPAVVKAPPTQTRGARRGLSAL
jgi:hypothetical protein